MKAAGIMAATGGLAAALGHAPFHFWFIAIPGLVLIIRAVSIAPTSGRAFRTAWFAGAAYFGVALHWIVEPFLVDIATHGWMAPFALLLMAGGLGLFWGLAGYLAFRIGSSSAGRALAMAAALAAMEMVRGHIFTGFPWALPGYVWADTPLRAVAAYTGSYGLTFLTLLAAALPSAVRRYQAGWIASACLLIGLFLIGDNWIDDRRMSSDDGRVAVIASDIRQEDKWQRAKVESHQERLRAQTAEAARQEDVKLVVWPESSVAYPLDVAGEELERAAGAAKGRQVILGINRREEGNWYNSMVVVGERGEVRDAYDKVHLVPFGEYIPFGISILRTMAATNSNGFSSGESVRLIDTALGRALPLICYEGIFPNHPFLTDERADFMILITNDAWFGTFAGPEQHFDQARFRAVEQGLTVVRAANRGVSGVIDVFGRTTGGTSVNSWQSRSDVISKLDRRTPYSRIGDLPLACFLIVTMIALWFVGRRNAIAKPDTLS